MKKYAAIALVSFLVGTGVHIWATLSFWEYENQLVQCNGTANDAWELTNQLLSNGRFIRQYDNVTGRSIYKFDYKWSRPKPVRAAPKGSSLLVSTQPRAPSALLQLQP